MTIGLTLVFLALQSPAQIPPMDADHDGRISLMEYIRGREARFDQVDRNHDGVVSIADFPRAQRNAGLAARAGALLSSADLDDDGRITRQELSVAGAPLFYQADRNADGFVDQAERAQLDASLSSPQ